MYKTSIDHEIINNRVNVIRLEIWLIYIHDGKYNFYKAIVVHYVLITQTGIPVGVCLLLDILMLD